MTGAKFNIEAEPNGAVVISNEDSRITIHPDGTIAISSYAPVQLTGACMDKLDCVKFPGQELINPYVVQRVVDHLMRRLLKK